jgi:hypothetical protein
VFGCVKWAGDVKMKPFAGDITSDSVLRTHSIHLQILTDRLPSARDPTDLESKSRCSNSLASVRKLGSVTPTCCGTDGSGAIRLVVPAGHSLRAGYCTEAATVGLQPYQIREQTGHKSDVTLACDIRPVAKRKIPSLL